MKPICTVIILSHITTDEDNVGFKQFCADSRPSDRNLRRWPLLRSVYTSEQIDDRKNTGRTDRRTNTKPTQEWLLKEEASGQSGDR